MKERLEKMQKIASRHQFNLFRREERGYTEVGLLVKEDETLWGRVPDIQEEDEKFILNLIVKAKNAALKI